MNASTNDLRTTVGSAVSRRVALRGLGGAGLAATLGLGLPGRVAANHHQPIVAPPAALSSDDPVAVLVAYVAAVNAGNLEGILALYADNAFHIALPSPDGSAGVCLGKVQFRMWYEQSMANGDRIEVEDGTLAVDGNQATFVARLSSAPWRNLGVEALDAYSQVVIIGGHIMTHVVLLTPDAVRRLQSARGDTVLSAPVAGDAWASTRQYPGRPH